MSRHAAALLVELGVATALMVALIATLMGVAVLGPKSVAADARDAEVEAARNLCRQLRAGLAPALAQGWKVERRVLDRSWEQVVVVAPSGLKLQTLRRLP